MSWNKVRLGDILTESKIISESPNPDRRITVRLKVLGVEKRGLGNEVKGATKQYIRRAGQFIYGKQNFHKGAFGIVPPELDGFESSSDLPAFDVDKSCLPEYIFYFFKQGNYYLELSKIASGVATQRINTSQLFEIQLLLPDIETQKKIIANIQIQENKGVEIASEINYQLSLIEKLRQRLVQDAVQGKLVPQKSNDEPASELLKKIKSEKSKLIAEKKLKKQKELQPIKSEEIPFQIPGNWAWCRLGELGITKTGTTPSTLRKDFYGDFIPFIKPADITPSGIITTNQGLSNSGLEEGVLIPKNSLLMVCIGGSTGKSFFNETEVSCNQQINTITTLADVSIKLLHYFVQSSYFQKTLWEKASGATTPIVNRSKWESILIPLPPLGEQNRIIKKLDELLQYCNELEVSIKESESKNEKLLQQVLKETLDKEPVTD